MPTKQELINMMDNHLPGEPVTIQNIETSSSQQPPPAYPDLEGTSFTERPAAEQIYTLPQPVTNRPLPTQFGTRSHLAYCPACQVTQMTRCEYESSMMTHIIATVLCCTTCCCCLPYLFNNCKTARHYCQNCGTYLGTKAN